MIDVLVGLALLGVVLAACVVAIGGAIWMQWRDHEELRRPLPMDPLNHDRAVWLDSDDAA